MNKKYRHLLRATLAALPLACVAMLSSCSYDDYGECPDSDTPATVRVSVSAGEPGDLNGTRAGDDVNADEHEFMHTLYVYIVNGTVVEKAFVNPIDGDAAAATGDLTNWSSEDFTLAPGEYTVYAFANLDGHNGQTNEGRSWEGRDFLTTCFVEGLKTFNGGDVEEFRLFDPAGNISFSDGRYIPMSAKKEITVTSSTREISIGLDRLVSKVWLTVSDGADVTDDSKVTFSGYSENVPLMEGSTSSDHGDRTGEFTAKLSDAEDTADGRQLSFYVNETPEGLPFTVTLATGNTTGVTTYTASPRRRVLPRNSIYPLTLTFPDFSPEIEWLSWVAPIGNYPVEVNVDVDKATYTVYIAEGAQFEFTVAGMASSTNTAKLVRKQWTVPDDLADKITDVSNSGATLSAALSAGVGVGTDLPLSLTVSWFATVEETNLLTRTYNVTIHTIDITDVKFKTGTRAGGSYGMRLLGGEVLNMFKVN